MVVVVVWGDEEEGEAWVLWKRFLIKIKKNQKKKPDVLLTLFILIFISIGPFFLRDIS